MTPQEDAKAISNLIQRLHVFRAGIALCAEGPAVPGLLERIDALIAKAEETLRVRGYKVVEIPTTAPGTATLQ